HAEAELDRLFELSLDLLCVAGTDGYFKHINPAFERVLGYSNGELLSRSFIEFVHPDDRDSTLERVEELAKGLPVVDFKNRYRAKNGAYRWLSWRSASLPEQGLIYAVARDIADEKRVQERLARQAEELARSNADLERFAYVASHDLRAPLRSIAQLAEWIREESATALPDEAREHLTLLDEQVRRLDGLIEDLLRFARAGHERVAGEQVDTATMIGELTSLLALPRGFLVEIEGEMPVLHTARAPLEQVFRNLLSNAIEHHDRSTGTVRVSAISSGERVEFVVADDGPGIPEQQRERIFKMFETLPSSAEHPGSGIGLALVRRLVEAFGGRVWVESTGERGATFRFTWPQRIEDPDA
ncbi:MAG: PAS domain S-box protein, partial [Acidobacteriota bacterium]